MSNINSWRTNKTYNTVYKLAKDSIDKWVKDSIEDWGRLQKFNYSLDKNFYFNEDSTRFESFLLFITNTDSANTNSDYIEWFYGEKIKGHWYFWNQNLLVLPRDYTKKIFDYDKHPSFSQISEIAMGHILGSYLLEEFGWPWEGSRFIINEDFFRQEFENGYLKLNLHTLDQVQKYKVWRQSMMYDTIERRGDYYTNINIDSLKVRGWDY